LTSRTPLMLAILAIALTVGVSSAQAFENPNTAQCYGHLQAGDPAPGDTDQQVRYTFGCSTPITGYQIQAQIPITGFDTSTIALDGSGKVSPTDSFTCNGDFPGIAFNCIGTYSGISTTPQFESVVGQFSIGTKLCAEPRVDPLLTVVYASVSSTGTVTQAIAGPFDLGRPLKCPKSIYAGSARIGPDGTPVVKTAPKHKAKAKTTRKHKAKVKKHKTAKR
jgi:hypothetical protein